MRPRAFHALTREPQTEVLLFAVTGQNLFGIFLVGIEVVAVAKLEEAEVRCFSVCVVGNALQATEEEGLAHHVEVGRKRVDKAHEMFGRISFTFVIISLAGKRVVDNFVETTAHELFAHQGLQTETHIVNTLDGQ